MRRERFGWVLAAVVAVLLPAILAGQSQVSPQAARLHQRAIVVDTHDDTTQRLIYDRAFDLGRRDTKGSIDIPRMRDGGLDAIFFSIWMDGGITGPRAVRDALRQIDAVHEAVRRHPDALVFARTAGEIRSAASAGRIAVLLGLEGGHMIDEDLGILRQFAALGVRYLTLTHSLNTPWADSSGDTPAHDGLTSFGRDVVRELNRLGVMVDVSHVSDKTFYDALEVTRAPVLASHSSARAIANSPRNMTDDMLRAVARNNGVVMINFNAGFLGEAFRAAPRTPELRSRLQSATAACGADQACQILEGQRINQEAMRAGELPTVSWDAIVEHIDHVVHVAGIDHVGFGSDFDGAVMPLGMEDVSKLPRITDALLKKGYAPGDIEKVLGGNLLRVMEQVEQAAGR